jgi:NAD(P)-dependent dehydrogenase (short-subunit alcohol dehydrogenase family)
MERSLNGKVALVDGATRGAGRAIAVELSRAGAFVYATGRSSRGSGMSDMGRPETIEETAERMHAAGGEGLALRVDHSDVRAVEELVRTIELGRGRLDILVNDIFGGHPHMQWDKKLWEHDIGHGFTMLRNGVGTHLITCARALPLMIRTGRGLIVEMTDGTSEYNKQFRRNVGFYYDLTKANVERITLGLAAELEDLPIAAIAVTPGWMRSEQMLENFGVTESTWRDALPGRPHFCISESPTFVARGIVALAGDPQAKRWSGRVLSSAELGRQYGVTDADGSQPDCWRYTVEVEEKGLPADPTGYR